MPLIVASPANTSRFWNTSGAFLLPVMKESVVWIKDVFREDGALANMDGMLGETLPFEVVSRLCPRRVPWCSKNPRLQSKQPFKLSGHQPLFSASAWTAALHGRSYVRRMSKSTSCATSLAVR